MKARRASTLACGHHVHAGTVIVQRAGAWVCRACVIEEGRQRPAEAATAARKELHMDLPIKTTLSLLDGLARSNGHRAVADQLAGSHVKQTRRIEILAALLRPGHGEAVAAILGEKPPPEAAP